MSVISLHGIGLSFGGPAILENVDLEVDRGERLCLVGRNGAGKSTLFKVLAREIQADEGTYHIDPATRVSRLEQDVPQGLTGSVYDVVAGGLGGLGEILKDYHHIVERVADDPSLIDEMARIQHALEAQHGWSLQQRIDTVLSRLQLDADVEFTSLSGGWKRRALLAQALVAEPDVLLLDEPTNHLDIEMIAWLEDFLLNYKGTLIFITHDRMFLRRMATRIIELDRGRMTSWPGNYDLYLERKQALLDSEASQEAEFDKKLAKEEVWIRQGIKARRTRNEGRVRALEKMRKEFSARRKEMGQAKIRVHDAAISGRIVIEAEHLSYAWQGEPIIKDFSTTIIRGDKIGIIGPNGCGKTTLLNLILGKLEPQQGMLRIGTKLDIAYFDQLRAQLDPEKSVQDNVADGADKVTVGGETRHVISYLQDFLFSPERARTPVKALSGGERNRLLLARIFTKPSNVLVLDEPTNDLDVDTLELLESLLVDYAGTILLVSHDREFIDNVVTSTLVFEGQGKVAEYVGGYADWLRQRQMKKPVVEKSKAAKSEVVKPVEPASKARKLSYKEQRELEQLPFQIEKLDAEMEQLQQQMAQADFYQQPADKITTATDRMQTIEAELATAYGRWEELEEA
jgi:ATP-binding cassette subfamily F protein uup